jgi:hypothetical protein
VRIFGGPLRRHADCLGPSTTLAKALERFSCRYFNLRGTSINFPCKLAIPDEGNPERPLAKFARDDEINRDIDRIYYTTRDATS